MATVPMLDMNSISPDMVRAAGMNPHRFERQLGDPSGIPVTQEDRDELGRVRNEKLRFMRNVGIIMFFTSMVSIIVGIIALSTASAFPYNMGGGILAGVAGIIGCLLTLCMLREGKKTPTGSETTTCFVALTRCHLILGLFLTQLIMIAFGMGGIWGTVECLQRTPSDDTDKWTINNCTPNQSTLLAISILTLILAIVILVFSIMTCCAYCCNMRAFGVKSGYERLLDLQMARVLEMQRIQQQQGVANMYGGPQVGMQYSQGQTVPNQYTPMMQGQYPPQGPYNQYAPQGQHGQHVPQGQYGQHVPQGYPDQNMQHGEQGYPYPSAPPKTDNLSDDPPSYRDVMEK